MDKMILQPRAYRDPDDLERMWALLQSGRRANNGTYYIHMGDLRWWLFYWALEYDLWEHITLWDDPAEPGRWLGWSLLSPGWNAFDIFFQPELRGSELAVQMYTHAEEQIAALTREAGKNKIQTMWVAQDDGFMTGHLSKRGFLRAKEGMIYMLRYLEAPIQKGEVPAGYLVRCSRGQTDAAARAKAQYGAFGSSAPFEAYVGRFRHFMGSQVYDPELDVVAATPDGQIAAFCIVWTDAMNCVGLFEPVGTHPDFQRKGLGKAVMLEALTRLKERSMSSAMVVTPEGNLPAVKFYEALGFVTTNILATYERAL